MPQRGEELFHTLFRPEHFRQYRSAGTDPNEQAEPAVTILETIYDLPDEVKNSIRRLYQEPGFHQPR